MRSTLQFVRRRASAVGAGVVAAVVLASPLPAQSELAKFEVELPHADPFILRGTLPRGGAGWVPGTAQDLTVLDPSGNPVPTQFEVVTRAPGIGSTTPANVIEVTALVPAPALATVGQRVTYNVVAASGPTPPTATPGLAALRDGPTNVPTAIKDTLLASAQNVLVLAKDPQGYEYIAYPLRGIDGIRSFRYGANAATMGFYEVMRPLHPLPATDPTTGLPLYPHLFGVHAYVTTQTNTPALQMDFRFNNGADGHDLATDADNGTGKVYFESLSLLVPNGGSINWLVQQQFADPFGIPGQYTPPTRVIRNVDYKVFPIVQPMPLVEGVQPMHAMPGKAQMQRRYVVSKFADRAAARYVLDQEGIAFALPGKNSSGVEYLSFFKTTDPSYFPQRVRLADLSFANPLYGGLPELRNVLTTRYTALRDAIANGTPASPDQYGNLIVLPGGHIGATLPLGWARPLDYTDAIAVSGSGIRMVEGERAAAARSADGYRYLMLLDRLHTERMCNAIWGKDGLPSFQDKWLEPVDASHPCPALTASPLPCPNAPDASGQPNGPVSRSRVEYVMDKGPNDVAFCPDTLPSWLPSSPNGDSPWSQNAWVLANGRRPFYDGSNQWYSPQQPDAYSALNINAFLPHGSSHLIRYLAHPMALVWLGNDALSKDSVLAQADMFRWTYTEYPSPSHSDAYWPGYTLFYARWIVGLLWQHWGIPIGRAQGWGITAANAAYAMQGDAYRTRMGLWYDRIVAVMDLGMGTISDPNFKDASSVPYNYGILAATVNDQFNFSVDAQGQQIYRGRQSWEVLVLENAVQGMLRSVYTASNPSVPALSAVSTKDFLSVVSPTHWNEAGHSMWGKVRVSLIAPTLSPLYNCDSTSGTCTGFDALPTPPEENGGETSHYVLAGLAEAYMQTGDPLFLRKAYETMTGVPCTTTCFTDIKAWMMSHIDPADYSSGMQDWSTNSNSSLLLGLVQ